jgi:hypothetical protein
MQDKINMGLWKTGFDSVGWIEVAQDFDGLCFCDIFE